MTLLQTKSNISPRSDGLYELHIEGRIYHPHWLAFLLSSLSQQHISTVSGTAMCNAQQEWDAHLVLDFGRSSSHPEHINYIALTQTRSTVDSTGILLSTFRINQRLDRTLEVRLEGPDQLGFLGRFLTRVSLLGLYPSEIEIDTTANQIKDRIVLTGIGGSSPGEAMQQSLNSMLQSLRI